ncbi:MAG: redoxin domain-containing protein [Planctomycetaceae bacterium]|nr:redoxin domain-containing protein [Planctomycetaceae bacterium]
MDMLRRVAVVTALVLVTACTQAADKAANLKVGDAAPTFQAQDDQGKVWKSADVVGKKILVVYFYPADMTGGCTKQACGFRDDMKKLEAKDVVVVGVSGDSVRNHQLFKKAEELNFTLLADEQGKVANAFGVPFAKGEKSIKRTVDGKEETLTRGGTAKRWTFVVDRDGKIAMKNTEVKAAEDSKAILQKVEELQ